MSRPVSALDLIKIVEKDGMLLEHIRSTDAYALDYARWAAVRQNGNALQFIPRDEQTTEHIRVALRQKPLAWRYADHNSLMVVLMHDGCDVLRGIKDRSILEREAYSRCCWMKHCQCACPSRTN
jgi:hypothetical protein